MANRFPELSVKKFKKLLRNTDYWLERKEREVEAVEKTADEFIRDMRRTYDSAVKEIEKEMLVFMKRYEPTDGEMTLADLHMKLSKMEMKSAANDIREYYTEVKRVLGYDPDYIGDISQAYQKYWEEHKDNDGNVIELRRRDLSARSYMSRLEELQMQMKHELETTYRELNQNFGAKMRDVYEDSYYHSIFGFQQTLGFSNEFTALNKPFIEKAVQQKWLGDNYSSRLWKHKENLIESLNATFLRGVALGQNPRVIARNMRKEIQGSYDSKASGNFERLARTEFMQIANQATIDGYKEHGVKQYQWLAAKNEKACEICGELDGQIFDLKDQQTGMNVPPAHPRCRCTVTSYFPPDEIDAAFEKYHREKGDIIPADIDFDTWYHSLKEEDRQMIFEAEKSEKDLKKAKKSSIIDIGNAETIEDLENFSKNKWGVEKVDLRGLDVEAVKGTFEAMDKAMEQYPQLQGKIVEIIQYNGDGFMGSASNFKIEKNRIVFNSKDYSDINIVKKEYNNGLSKRWFPQGTTWKNNGVHELGHVMTDILVSKNNEIIKDKKNDREKHITAKNIVKDAWKVTRNEYISKGMKTWDARSDISNYAKKSFSETIAEAFSDVFSNANKAKPLSKVIVDILNERTWD